MKEDKNLEQNLDKSNEKLHISDVIGSVDSKIDGGKERKRTLVSCICTTHYTWYK